MFIPYSDTNPRKHFPLITVTFIVINIIILILIGTNPNYKDIMIKWGFTPSYPAPVTLITALFIHASWLHLISNMLYLWIFGDNIEDRLGKFFFIIFYLLGGAFSFMMFSRITINPDIPMVGASGAVSALIGAYFVLFPHASIKILLFPIGVIETSALAFIGFWIFLQLLFSYATYGGASAGIAFAAHIAGFIFGAFIANIWRMVHGWKEISLKRKIR